MSWDPRRLEMVAEAVAEGMALRGGRRGWWSKLGPLNYVEKMVAKRVVADRLTFLAAAPGPREWERRLSPFKSW